MTSSEITKAFQQGKIYNYQGTNYFINTFDLIQYMDDYKGSHYEGNFIDYLIKEWHMIVIVVPHVEIISTSRL